MIVDHFSAQRYDPDQKEAPSLEAIENSSFNLLTRRRYMNRVATKDGPMLGVLGTNRATPGLLRGLLFVD
jgi:hypothetical protein